LCGAANSSGGGPTCRPSGRGAGPARRTWLPSSQREIGVRGNDQPPDASRSLPAGAAAPGLRRRGRADKRAAGTAAGRLSGRASSTRLASSASATRPHCCAPAAKQTPGRHGGELRPGPPGIAEPLTCCELDVYCGCSPWAISTSAPPRPGGTRTVKKHVTPRPGQARRRRPHRGRHRPVVGSWALVP
jgi:hypothetical protein